MLFSTGPDPEFSGWDLTVFTLGAGTQTHIWLTRELHIPKLWLSCAIYKYDIASFDNELCLKCALWTAACSVLYVYCINSLRVTQRSCVS